jgi:hypothetical protein
MTIKINNTLKLKDIQQAFHKKFPYLKIEFFSRPFADGEISVGKQHVDNETLISDIALKNLSETLSFSHNETVTDTERKLREQLGLFGHVFRKSGNLWIHTTNTHHWTLQHQEEHAEEGAKYNPQLNIIEVNDEDDGDEG